MRPTLALRACAAALALAASPHPAPAQQGGGAPAPAVVVAPAEIADLRPSRSFSGRLAAIQKIAVRARVSGYLRKVAFREGATVAAGDLLYEIEAEPYEAVVAQIKGSIAAAEAQLELAKLDRRRKEQLVERQSVAQSELDVAVANQGKAEGELMRLRGLLDGAELDMRYTRVTAPFAGVVGLTTYDEGAFVGPDAGTLTTLTRRDPMTVEFPIPSAVFVDYLQQRQRAGEGAKASVTITLPNGFAYPLQGTIDYVDAEVAQGTDTLTMRAEFDNPDGLLIDGALVTVSLAGAEPRPVLSVPQRAVQRDQVGAFVMTVGPDDKVALRRVEVGDTIQGRSVIRSGLEEGDLVIVEGVNKVRPGIVVDAATGNGG